jgi:hypothetical protein
MSKVIELQDVGPISRLEIPIPSGGGVVLLRGKNGAGKSHALAAVSALVGSGDKPTSRDGSLGAQVTGLGIRLTVGRRTALSGELEVTALDGEDPSLLVDPGIKSPDAADAERIRSLLRLSRSNVEPSAFAHLVGGDTRLRELCAPTSLESKGDVPAMASAIKRDLERAARELEKKADGLRSKAMGARGTLKDPDAAGVSRHTSAEEARAAHTEAVRAHAALEATDAQQKKLITAAKEARAALESLGESGSPHAIEVAETALTESETAIEAARAELDRKKAALEEARAAVAKATSELEQRQDTAAAKREAVARQKRQAEQRAALDRAVAAAAGACEISPDELKAAEQRVVTMREEAERWVMREKTARVLEEAARIQAEGDEAAREAADLRAAAKGTEVVVLEAVRAICGEHMHLNDGRLYVDTERGLELFSELSDGERWRRALDIAVKAVGRDGLLVVRQQAWESLDPIAKAEVAQYVKQIGVVVLTAAHDAGPIRAEIHEDTAAG